MTPNKYEVVRSECIDCLQSSIGMCNIHQPQYKMVSSTATTSEYTISELKDKIVTLAMELLGLRWYQSKTLCKKRLRYFVNELTQLVIKKSY